MCGAIALQYHPSYRTQLAQYLSFEEIERIAEAKEIVCAFWDKIPLLPVESPQGIKILQWGNRDKSISLPLTGWARLESLREKKWDAYAPKTVLIPAERGCEKGQWFPLDTQIRGIYIRHGVHERVYMITEAADEAYQKLTGHHRMPRLHRVVP